MPVTNRNGKVPEEDANRNRGTSEVRDRPGRPGSVHLDDQVQLEAKKSARRLTKKVGADAGADAGALFAAAELVVKAGGVEQAKAALAAVAEVASIIV